MQSTGPSGATTHLHDLAALRFPLVARPKPICRPLSTRLKQVQTRADQSVQGGDDALLRAAEALNLAALLASDCGMAGLARDLCRRQFALFHAARPLTAAHAQLALQPAINLGRLLIRDGDGQAAFRLLHALFTAVQTQGTVQIEGEHTSFSRFTRTTDDQRETSRWLWEVVLSDGTRALARAGRWNQALSYVEELCGIGLRLGDGRQIAILAQTFAQAPHRALELLDQSQIDEPWEKAVFNCLTVLCRQAAGRNTSGLKEKMVTSYLELDPEPTLVDFHSHLGLAVLDLLGEDYTFRGQVKERLMAEATGPGGGYAARNILLHPNCAANLREPQAAKLQEIVKVGALSQGQLPKDAEQILADAVEESEKSIASHLSATAGAVVDKGRRNTFSTTHRHIY